jgi:hypothetical protein
VKIINQASQVSLALAQKPEVLLKEILLDDKQEKTLRVDNQVEVFYADAFPVKPQYPARPGGLEPFGRVPPKLCARSHIIQVAEMDRDRSNSIK